MEKWIRLAVADVKMVVKNPKYEFNFKKWHRANGVCKVCFAGARMMGLGANPNDSLGPIDFKEESQLAALDDLRGGRIRNALHLYYVRFYKKVQPLVDKYEGTWYYEGILTPIRLKQFYKDMLNFAGELEKLGC